ncbi:hypothetical protein HFP15_18780 [Amycolatopsis sp. K13G38]|uniref:SRPBCC family protein n=1 Tax=Amycolatopsis acididurans TaxID=2724524 RepID=A0ABX1J547_9PSEU|nr:hypothetical protein [Amycolatopsis acididurans]NKQ54932.1 hypothetical protein [Amycolatopsis acididurans]
MRTVHYTATADLPADEAFAFMSDAPNLPKFLPEATERAWVQADGSARRLLWGTESDSDDHGELRVLDRGPEKCEIDISLRTLREDTDKVQAQLAEAVGALTHKASSDADANAAEPGTGWV